MQILSITPGAEKTGQIFPVDIQSREWIGYHGTSSAYSPKIERDGFSQEKPIPDADIQFVAGLSTKFGMPGASRVAGFRTLSSISFSANALIALAYAKPGLSSGQGVGYVRDAAQDLLEKHQSDIASVDTERLKRVVSMIDDIRSHSPVIYAVDLSGLKLARFQSLTAAIHVYEPISPARVLAKAVVPIGIDHDSIALGTLRDEMRALHRVKGQHWISQVQI